MPIVEHAQIVELVVASSTSTFRQQELADWTVACYLLAVPVIHDGAGGVYVVLRSPLDADAYKSNSSTPVAVRAFWAEPVEETTEGAHVLTASNSLSGIKVSILPSIQHLISSS